LLNHNIYANLKGANSFVKANRHCLRVNINHKKQKFKIFVAIGGIDTQE